MERAWTGNKCEYVLARAQRQEMEMELSAKPGNDGRSKRWNGSRRNGNRSGMKVKVDSGVLPAQQRSCARGSGILPAQQTGSSGTANLTTLSALHFHSYLPFIHYPILNSHFHLHSTLQSFLPSSKSFFLHLLLFRFCFHFPFAN